MNWVTIIWSMTAAACLTLAAINVLIWWSRRTAWAHLLFSSTAAATAAMAFCELRMMLAGSPGHFGAALSWLHVSAFVLIISLVGFVLFHMRAGRPWLAWTTCTLRAFSLLLNFLTGQNLNYREVTGLRHIPFLGESVSVGEGVPNPWMLVGQLSLLFFVVFVVDATLAVWRRGDQRHLLVTGASIVFFVLVGTIESILVLWQMVHWPYAPSICFLGIIAAMVYELSHEALRAAQLSVDLRESEEWQSLAASAAGVGMWRLNLATGKFLVTEKTRELFAYGADEAVTFERFLGRVHPEDQSLIRQTVQTVVQTRNEGRVEYRIVQPDGGLRWMHSRGRVQSASGEPDYLIGVSIDVSERKRTEETNRNADNLMAAVFNSVPGLLYLYSEDGRLLRWNRQHEVVTGYTAEELLNFPIQNWFAPEDQTKLANEFSKVFSEGFTRVELNLIIKNGQTVPHAFTGTKVLIDGKPYLVGIGIDISERKRNEEKVRQLLHTIEHSPVLVVITDTEGKVTYVNRKFTEVTGYAASEVIGQNPRLLKSGECSPEVYLELWRTITQGRTWRGEFHNRKKDGELYWESAVISPLLDDTGRVTHFVAIKEDITERKRADLEAQELRNNLVHLTRVNSLGALSGSLAHELNQPLGIILSNAQAAQELLAQEPPDVAEVQAILTDIVAADRRAGDVIGRLRALLKRGQVSLQPLSLNQVFEEVLNLTRSDLIERGVTVACAPARDLPPVAGDRVQLQQLVLNLILNAAEAMVGNAPGTRRLHLQTVFHQGRVRASVRDEGSGLPPDVERIFQAFYTTKAQGLGMGLAICRSIVAAHHGHLWAEPQPDRGALFHFELPVCEGASGDGQVASGATIYERKF